MENMDMLQDTVGKKEYQNGAAITVVQHIVIKYVEENQNTKMGPNNLQNEMTTKRNKPLCFKSIITFYLMTLKQWD